MFRRILLALVFVAALVAAGVGVSGAAQAHGGRWFGPVYGGYGYAAFPYSGYGAFYAPAYSVYGYGGYPGVYRTFGGGPRYHRGHFHGHGGHGYRGHGGLRISIGF
jgi:hypothetical protein